MNSELTQMAEAALKDLSGDGPWRARLAGARDRLKLPSRLDDILSSPPEVRRALAALKALPTDLPLSSLSLAICHAIETILVNAGKSHRAMVLGETATAAHPR
jgi:hypothetical protein